ncbi:acetylxylan esterase [Caulobacter segnis]|uniref:alpha/beta hydrolase n=1 Tax=Caulobacter segnis TaxID=88688 RepID=UPI00240ED493|nr:acetylxylan esterase [Caulobacter segnis]MDG2522114.1 acetylxylan esterase [Caulobacter segnis]
MKIRTFAAGLSLLALLAGGAHAAEPTGRDQLIRYIDGLADSQLKAREAELAAVDTSAKMDARKAKLRQTILDLIGGLPAERTPLKARMTGGYQADGYRVEKVVYESLPGYFVTANVYVPTAGKGPFPAVLITPGHSPDGKAGDRFGGNLAKAGILALIYDEIGMGERLQHYDPELGESKVGRPTGEHSMAYWQTVPVGDHVSRYFIWDAMRGLDYLQARADVDGARLGALGCSGGGTVTAFLTALDERVKAAASACYVNTFRHVLAGPGPQEAEQSPPGFIAAGLDVPDWVELAAPRPYAIVSTEADFFPFEGARTAYEEARRIWGLYGAQDRISWITGPGGHGNLAPVGDKIVGFFSRWLNNDTTLRPFVDIRPPRPEDNLVTATGQVSTALKGVTLQQVNQARAAKVAPAAKTAIPLDRLRADIRAVTNARTPAIKLSAGQGTCVLSGSPAGDLHCRLTGTQGGGRKRALLITGRPEQLAAARAQTDALAANGWLVMELPARGSGGTEEIKSALLGDWNLLSLRAMLAGESVLGLRTDDVTGAVAVLSQRDDVQSGVAVYALGAMAPAALHAAVLDERITSLTLDGALASYRFAVDRPIQRDLPEVLPFGVLRKYDLIDLTTSLGSRPVTWINPENGVGETLRQGQFEALFRAKPATVRWASRGARDPLVLP